MLPAAALSGRQTSRTPQIDSFAADAAKPPQPWGLAPLGPARASTDTPQPLTGAAALKRVVAAMGCALPLPQLDASGGSRRRSMNQCSAL